MILKNASEKSVRGVRIKFAVFAKKNNVGCVDKIEAEIFRKDLCAQIFTSACGIIFTRLVIECGLDDIEIFAKIKIEFETLDNIGESLFDLTELSLYILALRSGFIAIV